MAQKQKQDICLTRRSLFSATVNPQGSLGFLEKIVPVVLTCILDKRIQWNTKEDFITQRFYGITYKTLNDQLHHPFLQEIKQWLRGAMDALKRNYLREMYLVIENAENTKEILESYKLQFKYVGQGVM